MLAERRQIFKQTFDSVDKHRASDSLERAAFPLIVKLVIQGLLNVDIHDPVADRQPTWLGSKLRI